MSNRERIALVIPALDDIPWVERRLPDGRVLTLSALTFDRARIR